MLFFIFHAITALSSTDGVVKNVHSVYKMGMVSQKMNMNILV